MKMSQGGAQGSRQSISLLNKSQNVSQHNMSSQEPSIIVSSGQRARSSNKSAAGQKSNQVSGQTLTPQSPWTPERSTILVKSTSQIGTKKSIFTGMNTMNGQRRVFVDTSPEPNASQMQQKSSTSIHASFLNSNAGGNSKVNTSSLSAKPSSSRPTSSTGINLKTSSGQHGSSHTNASHQIQASHRSSSASFIKASNQGAGGQNQTSSQQSSQQHHNGSSQDMMQQVQTQSTANNNGRNVDTRERQYLEKIKMLKQENKKLISLLRDSEKLFYQKLKETKKESENLSTLFKQLWPLIKHKVKDPHGLLKTVNGLQGEQSEQANEKIQELQKEIELLKQQEKRLTEELKVEREQRRAIDQQWRRQMLRIQEMRAFQQTVQAYTHNTVSPVSPRNAAGAQKQRARSPANNHTASTADSSKMLQRELVPSFLKALYITSEDTIFDDDEQVVTQTSLVPALGLKSMTNSAEGALSAPEALKMRMQEINRSKSALATSSGQQVSQNQLEVSGTSQPSTKQISFHRGYYIGDGSSKVVGVHQANNQSQSSSSQQPQFAQQAQVVKTSKDYTMSQTQKVSMKSARERPSSNLGFNLQTSEQKPPRDRSQQNIGYQQTQQPGYHPGAVSGKADRHRDNPIGVPLQNTFFNVQGGNERNVNHTMVVPNKLFKVKQTQ